MTDSIRTEFEIGASESCPVALVSEKANASITHVARPSMVEDAGPVREQFAIHPSVTVDEGGIEKVFETGSHNIYQFKRHRDTGCVCATIESHDCPVSHVSASNGRLHVSFYAPDLETIQTIIADLRTFFDDVRVRKLTRADEHDVDDYIFVDRSLLTERQLEVLETCYEMGYFEYPRRSNASEVAEALDIAPSTCIQHITSAQRKILQPLLRS